MSASAARPPLTLLIAAMGGEGGGVLSDWMVRAAIAEGLAVQGTSIPGVAQRTGATTYYIELYPEPLPAGHPAPVFALSPGVGEVDVMLATELMEAARAVGNGFVAPGRTLLIASTHRVYAMTEKIALGDGQVDPARLQWACRERAREALLFDMAALAERTGSPLNAVLLGALAGSGALPIAPERFAAGIRSEGKAVEANLAGFEAGLAWAGAAAREVSPSPARVGKAVDHGAGRATGGEGLDLDAFPAASLDVLHAAVQRLVDYQDRRYAHLYLERLSTVRHLEPETFGELARLLALRMSYEDVIRVAQAKTRPERFRQLRREAGAGDGQPLRVTEFLKPGIPELCDMLPPALGRAVLAYCDRRGWIGRVYLPMHVRTTSLSGFLRIWVLARLRPWRRRTYRYWEEQRAIEEWLETVRAAHALSPRLAAEVVQCARLIKGYGSTHQRGSGNYRAILEHLVLPVLQGRLEPARAASSLAEATAAALQDEEGRALARVLKESPVSPGAAAAR